MEESLNKFIQIQDAYDVLSDTIIRKNYDAQHGFDTGTNREVKDISDEEIRNIIRRQSAKANKDSYEKKQSKDHNDTTSADATDNERPPIFRLLNYLYFAIAVMGSSMIYLGLQKAKANEISENKKS